MNPILWHHVDGLVCVRRLPGEPLTPGCTTCTTRRQAGRGTVMLWAMLCCKSLAPAIHVDVTLTRTTYLSIVADHVHPFMETVFPDGCGLIRQDNAPGHKAEMVQEWFEEHNNGLQVFTWPPNSSRIQSKRASVGCARQTSPIHEGPTSQLIGLKGSAANILVPDTTAHLQGSRGVHAFTGQGRFGSKRGPTQYWAGVHNVMPDWCINAKPTEIPYII